jgi:spermidine/putrescine transport system substrate-binding protein
MIDFVYDVENAARLAAWIYYISPVKGAGEEIAKTDEELAANELLFPSAETAANMFPQMALADEDDVKWAELASDLEGA